MQKYIPPYTISNKMLDMVGSIMEKLGLKSKESFRKNYLNPALEKELINNLICSIVPITKKIYIFI